MAGPAREGVQSDRRALRRALDYVRCKVEDFLEVLALDVKKTCQWEAGWALEVPDVAYRSSKLDVAHAVTTNLCGGYFNTAALAGNALEANAFVLTAGALPVPYRSKDLLAEKAVLFWLKGTVVDGLRLLYLAIGPTADIISRR